MFIDANLGQGIEQCFIVKQRSTRRFVVESIATGNQLTIRLVDNPALVATTPGTGVIEIGPFDSGFRVDEVTLVASGTGYTAGDILTVAGGTGTAATIRVDSAFPIDGDETVHDNYQGGLDHAVSDVITMDDGSTVTADVVVGGNITEFTLDSSTATIGSTSPGNFTISQNSTTGSGFGLSILIFAANQRVATASIQNVGSYTVVPSNPVATTGTGTGATFNLSTELDHNEYVSKLHNKSVRIHGVGLKESFSVNKSIPGTARNIHGQ